MAEWNMEQWKGQSCQTTEKRAMRRPVLTSCTGTVLRRKESINRCRHSSTTRLDSTPRLLDSWKFRFVTDLFIRVLKECCVSQDRPKQKYPDPKACHDVSHRQDPPEGSVLVLSTRSLGVLTTRRSDHLARHGLLLTPSLQ